MPDDVIGGGTYCAACSIIMASRLASRPGRTHVCAAVELSIRAVGSETAAVRGCRSAGAIEPGNRHYRGSRRARSGRRAGRHADALLCVDQVGPVGSDRLAEDSGGCSALVPLLHSLAGPRAWAAPLLSGLPHRLGQRPPRACRSRAFRPRSEHFLRDRRHGDPGAPLSCDRSLPIRSSSPTGSTPATCLSIAGVSTSKRAFPA
jgi:hypothetical protein